MKKLLLFSFLFGMTFLSNICFSKEEQHNTIQNQGYPNNFEVPFSSFDSNKNKQISLNLLDWKIKNLPKLEQCVEKSKTQWELRQCFNYIYIKTYNRLKEYNISKGTK